MTRDELIAAIEGATTKDDLEALGKEHLNTNVDKRKGVETIRAELLEAVDALYDYGEPETEATAADAEQSPDVAAPNDVEQTGDTSEDANGPNMPNADAEGGPSEEHTPRTEATGQKPKVDPVTNAGFDTGQRILENVNNGRRFVWTPILANLPNMREV